MVYLEFFSKVVYFQILKRKALVSAFKDTIGLVDMEEKYCQVE